MNIMILGAAGFIGTNLLIELAKDPANHITAVDRNKSYFKIIEDLHIEKMKIMQYDFKVDYNYEELISDQEIVYHLISTTVPTTSNQYIVEELKNNVIMTARLLDACVRQKIKKVVFISSGGAVYGRNVECPISEEENTNPITSYGIQKLTIEKLLYLYNYMYGLDYRVVRLANPYGPYQRPNGILGAVTTFTYKALMGEEIQVYGDGSVVRDFIYIDDAIRGIVNISNGGNTFRTFNLGSGYGICIKEVIDTIQEALKIKLKVNYLNARNVDVPVNYLDINRYENIYGKLNPISLHNGIIKTANFMRKYYDIEFK